MAALADADVTLVHSKSSNPGPLFAAVLTIALDVAYAAGGYADFQATVRTALEKPGFTLLGVFPNEAAGYVPVYDRVNDKLKIYEGDYNPAGVGPLTDNATADLSAVDIELVVIGF